MYLIYLRHLRHASIYIGFDGIWKALSLKNFFRIENPLSIKEVMSRMCVYVLFPSSTSPTYIALQPLDVFDVSLTSSTYLALQPLGVFDLSSTSSTCHISCTCSNYNVDCNPMSSNYSILFKPLIYFELQQSSNYFELQALRI